jgi:hypothetical protein
VKVHYFESTGDAYDASQCREDIKDGDILVVREEGVIGVLCKAWPVAVTKKFGKFHTFQVGTNWINYEDGKYLQSALQASQYYTGLE